MKKNYRRPPPFGRVAAGFTLIELLVVMAIIGLLASMISASVSTARVRAQAAKLAADFQQIHTSIEAARTSSVLWRVTGSGCSECANCMGAANLHTLPSSHPCIVDLTNAFVAKIGMSALPRDPWGNPYTLDENEQEGGPLDCRYDTVVSPGPDHRRGGDDITFNVPHFTCTP